LEPVSGRYTYRGKKEFTLVAKQLNTLSSPKLTVRRKRSALTKANYEALADFRCELRKFLAFSEAAAMEAGVTPQQHQLMLAIKGAPGRDSLSIGEIADRLLLRHHTIVELVDRLSDLGLVERNPDPTDRRKIQVSLTKSGNAAIDKLSSIHVEELRSIRPTLRNLLKAFERR
jgi:DNA-binding MarR family transcriptional regulator